MQARRSLRWATEGLGRGSGAVLPLLRIHTHDPCYAEAARHTVDFDFPMPARDVEVHQQRRAGQTVGGSCCQGLLVDRRHQSWVPPPEGAVEVLVDHLRANLEQEVRSAW